MRSPRARLTLLLAAAALVVWAEPIRGADRDEVGDSIVVVVSADSPVTEMPRLHLADLYLGRTTRFHDGAPAEPIDQAADSQVRERFYEAYLGRSQAEIKAHWAKIIFTGRGRPPRSVSGSEEVKKLVAGDPRAIGYLERRLVDDELRIIAIE